MGTAPPNHVMATVPHHVMAGLVPAIHVSDERPKGLAKQDARNTSGHDDRVGEARSAEPDAGPPRADSGSVRPLAGPRIAET